MYAIPNDAEALISELVPLIHQVQAKLGATPVSKKLRNGLLNFNTHYEKYLNAIEQGQTERLNDHANNIGLYGVVSAQGIAETTTLDEEMQALGRKISPVATKLRSILQNDPSTYTPLEAPPPTTERTRSAISAAEIKRIEQLIYELEKQDQRVKGSLAENEKRISSFEERLTGVETSTNEEIAKIKKSYSDALIEIEEKKRQINSILGHVSGRAIAGDYESSAVDERAAANWLRGGSLACLALIVAVVCYSFIETTSEEFEWQKSLFRIVLAFLLSAPAAYLARESTKHRLQQYHHLQTSLDLKAITPYLASLPEDVQHKIKSEIAAKLFAGKDFGQIGSESYPVNTQELLMELIKKLELPKAPASNDKS